jgi:hypothetical protein
MDLGKTTHDLFSETLPLQMIPKTLLDLPCRGGAVDTSTDLGQVDTPAFEHPDDQIPKAFPFRPAQGVIKAIQELIQFGLQVAVNLVTLCLHFAAPFVLLRIANIIRVRQKEFFVGAIFKRCVKVN